MKYLINVILGGLAGAMLAACGSAVLSPTATMRPSSTPQLPTALPTQMEQPTVIQPTAAPTNTPLPKATFYFFYEVG